MTTNSFSTTIYTNTQQVSVIKNYIVHAKALFIFAHGAGADKSHQFMQSVSEKLNDQYINVLRFNFPYMDKRLLDGKKYPPNRMPILVDCYQEIVQYFLNNKAELTIDFELAKSIKLTNHVKSDNKKNNMPIFIGGKSMGGRVAATLTAQNIKIAKQIKGVVCIGYPFHPQKKPENLRLTPLQSTTNSMLILQGERDALGDKSEIENYDLPNLCKVIYFSDGDHDLKPRIKSGFTHQHHIKIATNEIVRFIDEKS